jgi:hypothetical protein
MKLDKGRYGKYSLAAVESMEPHVPWQLLFLQIRVACYQTTHDPRLTQAERDLRIFFAEEPERLDEFVRPSNPASNMTTGTTPIATP